MSISAEQSEKVSPVCKLSPAVRLLKLKVILMFLGVDEICVS